MYKLKQNKLVSLMVSFPCLLLWNVRTPNPAVTRFKEGSVGQLEVFESKTKHGNYKGEQKVQSMMFWKLFMNICYIEFS
jgi:hypothetical protein